MIRLAKIGEIPHILSITKACASHLRQKGIYQWNEHYPSLEVFEKDVMRQELYVFELQKKVIGTLVLSTLMDKEYVPVKWLTANGDNLYVHRLAVHPTFQGKGYAGLLMDFAETYARGNGFVSIRLDTFSQNHDNQKFYERRGYQRLGNIYFPKQSKYPFYCFELVL